MTLRVEVRAPVGPPHEVSLRPEDRVEVTSGGAVLARLTLVEDGRALLEIRPAVLEERRERLKVVR